MVQLTFNTLHHKKGRLLPSFFVGNKLALLGEMCYNNRVNQRKEIGYVL